VIPGYISADSHIWKCILDPEHNLFNSPTMRNVMISCD
jgi:hypothetical protein